MAIDRLNLGMRGLSNYSIIKKWKIADIVLCVLLYVINIPIYYAAPFERQFSLNDLSLAHPHAETQRVGSTALLTYSLVIPIVTIVLVSFVLADSQHRSYLAFVSVLGLSVSWVANNLVTDFLKNLIGRPRPDFLARCKPKEGTPVDVLVTAAEVCTSKNLGRLRDGFRSTPSGHSSESFAGLGYLSLWLAGQLLVQNPAVSQIRKALAFLPLVGAVTIALSRTEDYRHHFVDVILGSCLGMFFAYNAYFAYFPGLSCEVPFKPLLDDTDLADNYDESAAGDEEATPLRSN
ncbi:LADA_0E07272g1_1 [Lachancea dasiensis]|uniref:LADA_0E07272g1_1 n=1 Tax=Lachancea dasiensis TaxID=1072105 RepID=A0A1G4JCT9_9SACH|nr:LADA_0E07272g1_1 [Lachancea dasiensis]